MINKDILHKNLTIKSSYFHCCIAFTTALPKPEGDSDIIKPESLITLTFESASPLPPLTIAPACPIVLPGGAVLPAIKPAIGFFIL
jgi:hypothetical protein